ncbi:hypothetical protein [Basilea psittacipulmonis]|uniref:Lipoprotein n=1 Tax=Basilea psittacipulmonis DSM 24701 TaxID=1072685 RepID=A0A077DCL6_9BURK|nr:hypothetical protein [Basilea psittacipulmonis]AIL31926.1 hypothetical protein IX83_00030 [Basilea psittacipulmonis DSM 24701]
MKKFFIFMLLTAGVLGLTACSNSEEEMFKKHYMESCTDGADKQLCECSYDEIMKKYTIDELKQLGTSKSDEASSQQFIQDLSGIILKCHQKNKE